MTACSSCGSEDRYKSGRCAPCTRVANQRWKAANRDRHRAGSAAWQAANREARRKTTREWGRKNREAVSAYRREWRRLNPERHAMHEQKRRALKAGSAGSYTMNEWLALCAAYGGRCLRCGCIRPLTVDHVVPLASGGPNRINNIQPLCGPCNSSKGTSTRDYRIDWMTNGELVESIPPAYTEHLGAQLLAHLNRKEAA